MKHFDVLKQLGVNALFWTGLLASALTALQGNYYFVLFFAGLVVINFAIIILVEHFWPRALRIEEFGNGGLVFLMKPVTYPKVLDEEKRAYLPEFIHLDILSSGRKVFAGDLGRGVMKQLRDSLDQVLATEVGKSTTTMQKPAVKKTKKKS